MRQLYFLLPGTSKKFACGGLWAELKTLDLAKEICPAEVVTYRQRESQTLFLDDLLKTPQTLKDVIFVMSWGFDVAKLAKQLRSFNLVYHAHSSGYGFQLPAPVPIITVSRNTMGYWGQKAPHSLIYYLTNEISPHFCNHKQPRDIDVLVHGRKSSEYLLKTLVPVLEKQCNVTLVNGFVDDFAALLNRTKVYLYDSAEYWAIQGVSEGFGLQPLEAMACGCEVFSSLNGGLSDYLDPGFNSYKISGYATEYDVQRILKALKTPKPFSELETLLSEYRKNSIVSRLGIILEDINEFFDGFNHYHQTIPPLNRTRLMQMQTQRFLGKLRKIVFKRT